MLISFEVVDELNGIPLKNVRAKVKEILYGGRVVCDDADDNVTYTLYPDPNYITIL